MAEVADEVPGRPAWDAAKAQAIVGSHVLIGITRHKAEGVTQEQMFGEVVEAHARHGFKVALDGSRRGETYWLPPHIDNFVAAQPGEYRLRSTGETVVDPDYISTWTIEAPSANSDG